MRIFVDYLYKLITFFTRHFVFIENTFVLLKFYNKYLQYLFSFKGTVMQINVTLLLFQGSLFALQ